MRYNVISLPHYAFNSDIKFTHTQTQYKTRSSDLYCSITSYDYLRGTTWYRNISISYVTPIFLIKRNRNKIKVLENYVCMEYLFSWDSKGSGET